MNRTTAQKACIVDDDRLYVSLIRMLIYKHKLAEELIIFDNGQKAADFFLQELKKPKPDLPEVVLLDLNMPVMDGWEFLDALEPYANKLAASSIKINVVSSTINPAEIKRASEHAIVNNFMTKPIKKNSMIQAFIKKVPA
ncbi:response regulator [Nonlabens xiamenensis]|uniref:response regulator n=1 Tax=Nonlabens xiamenensis TaxID=2341043 RepID=UPI000F60C6BA|nr:response regulator [Nonlabens xiamenensis]